MERVTITLTYKKWSITIIVKRRNRHSDKQCHLDKLTGTASREASSRGADFL